MAGRLRWKFEPPAALNLSAPVLMLPLVVLAYTSSPPGMLTVVALDARSGTLRWKWSTSAPAANDAWVSADANDILVISAPAGPPLTTPKVGGAWLLTSTGQLVWSLDLRGIPRTVATIGDGVAIVLTDHGLEALRISDGKRLWTDPKASGNPGPAAVLGRSVIANHGTSLYRYDLHTGRKRAEVRPDQFGFDWFRVFGDRLCLGGVGIEEELICYRARDFAVQWRVSLTPYVDGSLFSALPLGNDILAAGFGSAGDYLFIITPDHGLVWRFDVPEPAPPLGPLGSVLNTSDSPNSLISTGSAVIVSTDGGLLEAFGPRP